MGPDVAAAWRATLAGAPRTPLTTAELHPLTGAWRNARSAEVRRTVLANDTLVLQGGTRLSLTPLGPRRFRAVPTTEVSFEGDSAGTPARLVVRTAGNSTTFARVAMPASPVDLAEYAATYYSPEVDVTYQLRVANDTLAVWRVGRRIGVLEPAYRDVFMRGATTFEFTRDRRGRVSGFVLEAGRVRHLRFDLQPGKP